MKYTHKIKRKIDGGTSWMFVPPEDVARAGVLSTRTFRDGRTARHEIPKLIALVDSFRRGEIVVGRCGPSSTLSQVLDYYLNTKHFNSLSYNTQKNYEYNLKSICAGAVFNKSVGNIPLNKLNTNICTEMYDQWEATVSTDHANQLARIFSVLINYCISMELMMYNPMKNVKKRSHTPRSIIWTNEQVELFLDTAFSKYKWRNVGLLVLFAYEWGQRPVDIRNLTWDSIDFTKKTVTITQSKRGATVELPIDDRLMEMLEQQDTDWGWQQYVVPCQRASDNAYRPLSVVQMNYLVGEVKDACDLPSELRVGDLRKTAIVEMIKGGAEAMQVMSVTGHKNITSLNPYLKHNLETATEALDRRKR
mgnify:FL=1